MLSWQEKKTVVLYPGHQGDAEAEGGGGRPGIPPAEDGAAVKLSMLGEEAEKGRKRFEFSP